MLSINNKTSSSQNITSGQPQGSMLRPKLFKLFPENLLFFVLIALVHNFANDNSCNNR